MIIALLTQFHVERPLGQRPFSIVSSRGLLHDCENFANGLFAALVQGDGLQPAVGRGLGDRHQADGGGTLLLREAGRRAAAGGHAGRPHQDVECSRKGVGV